MSAALSAATRQASCSGFPGRASRRISRLAASRPLERATRREPCAPCLPAARWTGTPRRLLHSQPADQIIHFPRLVPDLAAQHGKSQSPKSSIAPVRPRATPVWPAPARPGAGATNPALCGRRPRLLFQIDVDAAEKKGAPEVWSSSSRRQRQVKRRHHRGWPRRRRAVTSALSRRQAPEHLARAG